MLIDILDASMRKPLNLTNIMYKSGINCATLKKFLELLVQRGLLNQHGNLFKTTSKGYEFIQTYQNLMRMIGSENIPWWKERAPRLLASNGGEKTE